MNLELVGLVAAFRRGLTGLAPRALRLGAWLLLALAATGCVRVYHPMSGFHRPVVVNPQLANFQDLHLTVHCVPDGLLNAAEASTLCQKVGLLFENQGARVTTTTSAHGSVPDDLDETSASLGDESPTDAPPSDLSLVLRARRLHQANDPLLWAICIATFTVVPGVTESTFAQEVVVRDGTGFLLVSESLEGRLVRRFGAGTWVVNKVADLWRDDDEKLTGDAANRDLSADLYRQLSQIVFNAKMQWQILQQAPSVRAR